MKFPEKFRVHLPLHENLNSFIIPFEGRELHVIASDWGEWQHISVSLINRCPNWREMSYIKDLFWDDEEECIQFHPKKSQYINIMQYCLHIWKPPIQISEALQVRIDL
jgi:hypothetical protein